MIINLQRSILCYCPICSSVNIRTITAFNLTKAPLKLYCSEAECHEELVTIRTKKDKYNFTVNCSLCGEAHNFSVSKKTMWKKDFFILNCPLSGLGILFVGTDEKHLRKEYFAQNEMIAGILSMDNEECDVLDIMMEIIEILNDFAADNAIKCKCGSDDINLSFEQNGDILLSCRNCSNSLIIPATEKSIDMLDEKDILLLD